eukprot:scaffold128_cov248-Pinguiococcus_pyrenoidosus.AAC.40
MPSAAGQTLFVAYSAPSEFWFLHVATMRSCLQLVAACFFRLSQVHDDDCHVIVLGPAVLPRRQLLDVSQDQPVLPGGAPEHLFAEFVGGDANAIRPLQGRRRDIHGLLTLKIVPESVGARHEDDVIRTPIHTNDLRLGGDVRRGAFRRRRRRVPAPPNAPFHVPASGVVVLGAPDPGIGLPVELGHLEVQVSNAARRLQPSLDVAGVGPLAADDVGLQRMLSKQFQLFEGHASIVIVAEVPRDDCWSCIYVFVLGCSAAPQRIHPRHPAFLQGGHLHFLAQVLGTAKRVLRLAQRPDRLCLRVCGGVGRLLLEQRRMRPAGLPAQDHAAVAGVRHHDTVLGHEAQQRAGAHLGHLPEAHEEG